MSVLHGNSQAFTLTNGRKTTWFDNHCKFLPFDHVFKRNKNSLLKNRIEMTPPPPIMTGEQILMKIDDLGLKKVIDIDYEAINGLICKACGWNKWSIFWDFPYWSSNLIRHYLDVMHIENNVFKNVFNIVMHVEGKTKDNEKARENLKVLCRRLELEKNEAT